MSIRAHARPDRPRDRQRGLIGSIARRVERAPCAGFKFRPIHADTGPASPAGGTRSSMDLGTLIGFVFGLGLVVFSMTHGFHDVGLLKLFIHVPAAMMVVGGSLAALLIHFKLEEFKQLGKVIGRTFLYPIPSVTEEIDRIVLYAGIARKDGLLALESKLEEVKDPFFSKGIRLIIDGFSANTVKDILELDAEVEKARHATGKKMLEQFGTFAPAFGMVETLIALVQMLSNLSDPTTIGVGMAGALVGTFYGAFVANMVMLPMAGKLDVRAKQEYQMRELMVAGIMAIQAGEKPVLIKERLKAFLTPKMRAQIKS
ncbi:MAG: motility protein A [Planctomycetota bacterium]|nr:MAG: motility protein A [Planctomycetota bacterium]